MTTLIIGDGAAAAAAAHVCLDAVVLSAGDRDGGRLESRTHGDVTYDIGTTCFRDAGDERSTLLREVLAEDCTAFEGPVETFGAGDECGQPGITYPRLTGRRGLEAVADRLFEADHCERRTDVVEELERTDGGWRAHTADGSVDAERVVLATGADRTAALLSADGPLASAVRSEARRVEHRTVDSVVLGYDHPVDRDWYALAAADPAHDVRWLSRESAKPGRVPGDQAALVVRLGDDWASTHDPAAAVDRARGAAAALLDDDRLRDPAWTDHERYRYARPRHRVDNALVERAAAADCHLAGDWIAGTDRTFAPLETGLDAGRRAMGFAEQAALQ